MNSLQQPNGRISFTPLARFFLGFFMLAASVGVAEAATAIRVKQGDIVRLVLQPGAPDTGLEGRFNKRAIPFFKTGDGGHIAVLGIDMDLKTGDYVFRARWQDKERRFEKIYPITVLPASFPVQKLTLPKGMVDLDAKALLRVKGEKALMKAAFRKSSARRLWRGGFIAPVKGKRQGTFGRRRVLNGKPRRPHTGEDISAASGTSVLAPNGGKVVLVGDFFFNGRSIVIDHGLGLFSMYFHLSEISVEKGVQVNKGDLIGRVGASGRVTGPHLHWGVRLNGARIDPFSLVRRDLD